MTAVPPPPLRVPKTLASDPETAQFFDQLQRSLHRLWRHSSGALDPVPITSGGTGGITAPLARVALGLEIGVDVQAYAALLDGLAVRGAYVQTYATAALTHANLTSATLTDSTGGTANTTVAAVASTAAALTDSTGGTANTTVAAVSGSGDDATINDNFADLVAQVNALTTDTSATTMNDNFADLAAQVNALIADLTNLKQVVNSLIDDAQANGLAT